MFLYIQVENTSCKGHHCLLKQLTWPGTLGVRGSQIPSAFLAGPLASLGNLPTQGLLGED